MEIKDLELSVRTSNVLKNAGIETIAQFRGLTRAEVLKMNGAGAKTWREIADMQRHVYETYRRTSLPGRAASLIFQLNEIRPELTSAGFFVNLAPNGLLRLYRELKKEDFDV